MLRDVDSVTITIVTNGVPESATLNLQGLNQRQLEEVGHILPIARDLKSKIATRNKLAEGH